MYKEYKDMLDEVGKYIHHLEETILNYESKLADMELEDMIEPVVDHGLTEKYPGKSKYYYNRLEEEAESRCVTEDTVKQDHEVNKQTTEEWAYSKTEGNDDEARREALAKSAARQKIELKKLDSLK